MKKKGAALLVVIIIMMLTFILATIMIEASIKHLRVSRDTMESTKAYYCAETGVYDAINYIELMASTGSFNSSYYNINIPLSNLYSNGENANGSNVFLFGDPQAIYTASIKLIPLILYDFELDPVSNKQVSTPLTMKQYMCTIFSKGTYNNQSYLINDNVLISYDNAKGVWTYRFNSKLSTKD